MESEQKRMAGEKVIYFACRFAECSKENATLRGANKEAGRAQIHQVKKMMVEAVEKYEKEN